MKNVCHICGTEFEKKDGICRCPSCGAVSSFLSSEEERTLLALASQKLRLADFDGAEEYFKEILTKYPECGDACWGELLALYGIKYETDRDGTLVPTFCKTPSEDIRHHDLYRKAIRFSDPDAAAYYEKEAVRLEQLRREWADKAKKEPPYDIFLSYKQEDGKKDTRVRELFAKLKENHYRVFFSEESLKRKIGEKYEPYIFHAVDTSRVMVVYARSAEEITSTWMKNEWLRFLKLIKKGEKSKNSLIFVCDGFPAKELPGELASCQCLETKPGEDFIKTLLALIHKRGSLSDSGTKRKKTVIGMAVAFSMIAILFVLALLFLRECGKEQGEEKETTPSAESASVSVSSVPLVTASEETSSVTGTVADTDKTEYTETGVSSSFTETAKEETATIKTDVTEPTAGTSVSSGKEVSSAKGTPAVTEKTPVTGTTAPEIIPRETTVTESTEATTDPSVVIIGDGFKVVTNNGSSYVVLDTDEGLYYSKKADGTYSVCGYDASIHRGQSLMIRESVLGAAVTEIQNSTYGCPDKTLIRKVVLPDSVKAVGEYAFEGFTNLESLSLGNGIESIGRGAFQNCTKLGSVDFPASLKSIGENAFDSCMGLEEITLEEGLKSIGAYAFEKCTMLKSVTVPSTVTEIGYGAFLGDTSFVSCSLKMTGCKTLSGTFMDCTKLEELIIPEGVTEISYFFNMESVRYIELPSTIVRIERNTFINSDALEKIWIKGDPVYIGSSMVTTPTMGTIYFECDSASPIWENYNAAHCKVVFGQKVSPKEN